jgi:hypothetical protein
MASINVEGEIKYYGQLSDCPSGMERPYGPFCGVEEPYRPYGSNVNHEGYKILVGKICEEVAHKKGDAEDKYLAAKAAAGAYWSDENLNRLAAACTRLVGARDDARKSSALKSALKMV